MHTNRYSHVISPILMMANPTRLRLPTSTSTTHIVFFKLYFYKSGRFAMGAMGQWSVGHKEGLMACVLPCF